MYKLLNMADFYSNEDNIKKLKEEVHEVSHDKINAIVKKKAINNTAPSNAIKDSQYQSEYHLLILL